MMKTNQQPKRSLRTILIIGCLFISIVPLAFITGYSIIKYEKGIEHELIQRLLGNAREIQSVLDDYRKGLTLRKEKLFKEDLLISHLQRSSASGIAEIGDLIMQGGVSSTVTFFNRSGKILVTFNKRETSKFDVVYPPTGSNLYLSEQNFSQVINSGEYLFVDYSQNQSVNLILLSKLIGPKKRTVGFIEQDILINNLFLTRLKERLKIEMILLRSNGRVITATHPDFLMYSTENMEKFVISHGKKSFELIVRDEPYAFVTYPIKWGNSDLVIALGASKSSSLQDLKKINYAFYSVVAVITLMVILLVILISNIVLGPLENLVEATRKVIESDQPLEIPIRSDTEIGLLTQSFNEMNRNIVKARNELKSKITELEKANFMLKETQSQLVHSSKMISLGQLVAGVAHELNNPIGFIFSNMTLLGDYSNKLLKLVDAAEVDATQIQKLKVELDIDYIKSDLPKLILSCQEGARRTKDIVMGLRNFSRLENAKLEEANIHDLIDSTLELLKGEMKNRIQIHKDYRTLPKIKCYSSQLKQVFMNILSNAIQAIEESGNIWVTTQLLQEPELKGWVQISIQDSGIGIEEESLDKIFDPFYSTKGVGQGTGLGLSISYGIIKSHGGNILVNSQKGMGTEFVMQIPPEPINKNTPEGSV